jgi:hypothetical protein
VGSVRIIFAACHWSLHIHVVFTVCPHIQVGDLTVNGNKNTYDPYQAKHRLHEALQRKKPKPHPMISGRQVMAAVRDQDESKGLLTSPVPDWPACLERLHSNSTRITMT